MKRMVLSLLAILSLCAANDAAAQQLQLNAALTDISVEFYTPTIVRVVKRPAGSTATDERLVVTARPEEVSVTTKGSPYRVER